MIVLRVLAAGAAWLARFRRPGEGMADVPGDADITAQLRVLRRCAAIDRTEGRRYFPVAEARPGGKT